MLRDAIIFMFGCWFGGLLGAGAMFFLHVSTPESDDSQP